MEKFKIEQLIDDYYDQMYWFIRKIVRSHHDAEDVAQNSWIRINNNLNSFREESTIKTWIFQIAYNESIRFLEKNKKKWSYIEGEDNRYIESIKSDTYFCGEDFHLKFHNVLSKLSFEERNIFQLKYFDDLKFNEVSQIIDLNENTIKTKYYRITKFIESELKKLV